MKIICVGRNYADHAKELNNPLPSSPLLFMKPSTALLVNQKPFFIPEHTREVHYEVEIVLRIGKKGKAIAPEFAHRYIDAVTVGIDFTARDTQEQCKQKGHPWEIAKAFDHSAGIGTWLPVEETGLKDLDFSLKLNGQTVQHGNTRDMIFPFEKLLAYASSYFTLLKGDFLFTGTPAGVGPVKPGDLLEAFLGTRKLLHTQVK